MLFNGEKAGDLLILIIELTIPMSIEEDEILVIFIIKHP